MHGTMCEGLGTRHYVPTAALLVVIVAVAGQRMTTLCPDGMLGFVGASWPENDDALPRWYARFCWLHKGRREG
jgi:hypothetical protein